MNMHIALTFFTFISVVGFQRTVFACENFGDEEKPLITTSVKEARSDRTEQIPIYKDDSWEMLQSRTQLKFGYLGATFCNATYVKEYEKFEDKISARELSFLEKKIKTLTFWPLHTMPQELKSHILALDNQ